MLCYLLQTRQAGRWKLGGLLLWAYGLSLQSARVDTLDNIAFFHEQFSVPVVTAVLTGCYALLLLIITRKLRLGQATWLGVAGALTYPIYLLHHNMGYLVLQCLGGHVDKYALLATMLVVLLLLAWLLHVFVERPFSKKLGEKVRQLLAAA